MTVRFYTGRRIISSVLHQCVRAAVKGLSLGVFERCRSRMFVVMTASHREQSAGYGGDRCGSRNPW